MSSGVLTSTAVFIFQHFCLLVFFLIDSLDALICISINRKIINETHEAKKPRFSIIKGKMRTLDQKGRQKEQISLKDARCTKIQIILHFSGHFSSFLLIPQRLAFKCTCFSASKTKLQMFIFIHIRWHSGTSLTFHSSVEKLLHHSLLMKKNVLNKDLFYHQCVHQTFRHCGI